MRKCQESQSLKFINQDMANVNVNLNNSVYLGLQ